MLIQPPQIVPADSQHLHAHLHPVANRVDLGTVIVGPLHRDLDDVQLELVGQKQQLRVESPALDALPREDSLGRRAGKRLEAALGVTILQSQNHPQREIEKPSVQLAIPWLALSLQRSLEPARADGDLRASVYGSE